MEYRIADQEAFTVIGKSIQLSCQDGAHHRLIPQFWGECTQDGTVARLNAIGSGEQLFGIVLDMQADQETMTYMIATKGSPSTQTDGFERRTVPANAWAVFASVGPVASALPHVFQRIYQEWFPATGYEHANGPVLEVYPPGDVTAADYRCEAWVPVVKK